jgi:hypothetical protein
VQLDVPVKVRPDREFKKAVEQILGRGRDREARGVGAMERVEEIKAAIADLSPEERTARGVVSPAGAAILPRRARVAHYGKLSSRDEVGLD